MKRLVLTLLGGLVVALLGSAQPATNGRDPHTPQLLAEQQHFLECLAFVYSPALWVSYQGSLYFYPHNEDQDRQIEAMKEARSRYVALTNRVTRHDLVARALTQSGIADTWKTKILLPYSATNQNLTPTLNRQLRTLPEFELLQSSTNGDALIQSGDFVYFVMDFGRGLHDATGTNALLIKEGTKTYTTAQGQSRTIEAFQNVALNREETQVFRKVSAAFGDLARSLGQQLARLKTSEEEFELTKSRATDNNPYFQFLVGKAYREGLGTSRDEKLGLEWLGKAARNGSGDAAAYLEKLKADSPPPARE